MNIVNQPQILDSLSSGIFLLDEELNISYINESAQYLIENSLSRVTGQSLFNFILDNRTEDSSSPNLFNACERCNQEGIPIWLYEVTLDFLIPRQSQKMNCRISALEHNNSSSLLLELIPLNDAAPRLGEKLNTVKNHSVIRGLAHEIRNPLGGIRGAAQLLSHELLDSDQKQYTDIIIKEADRLSKLVAQMQASSEIKKMQKINVHSILEHVRLLTISRESTSVPVVTDYDPSLPDIAGDTDQLIQAVLNIVQNSNESCSDIKTGKITLRTRIDTQILPGNHLQQQVVRLDIEDNGCGISSEIIDHIFEPMVSTKSEGNGLGLSITAEIIRYHGGAVSVSSIFGQTKFSIYLQIWGQSA